MTCLERSRLGRSAALWLFLAVFGGEAWAAPISAAQRLEQLGTAKAVAQRAARHVLLGLPSKATRQNPKDLLLVRNGYVISYNGDRNAMNWASWSLQAADLGAVGRQRWIVDRRTGDQVSVFRPDPTLPKGMTVTDSGDYVVEEGYTRGHMVRSGERTGTVRENLKTFYFTNMLPQSQNNNNGPWNAFENYYRDKVQAEGYEAQIIAGGIFGKSPVAAKKVAVPSETWKIVVLKKPGQQLEQLDEHTRVIAIRMPNDNVNIHVDDHWQNYRTSVADLEKATGLTFFDHLPPAVASALKAKVDQEVVQAPAPRHFPVAHDSAPTATKTIATAQRGTVKWYSPDKGYGFVTLSDGQEVFLHKSSRLTTVRDGEAVELDLVELKNGKLGADKVRSLAPKALPLSN